VAKKPEGPSKIPVDFKLLKPEDRKALREEARKSVLEEMSQDARDAFFKQALSEARRSHIPAEMYVEVMMDMAPFLPHVMIDGVQYFHGYSYQVEQHRAVVLYEQMQRSWQHQDEIDGRSKFNSYRKPVNARLGPQHMGTATRGANGVVEAEI
jgi:hypothetical protein